MGREDHKGVRAAGALSLRLADAGRERRDQARMQMPAFHAGHCHSVRAGGFFSLGTIGTDAHARIVRRQRKAKQRAHTLTSRLGHRLRDERRRVLHPDIGAGRQARLPQCLFDTGGLTSGDLH